MTLDFFSVTPCQLGTSVLLIMFVPPVAGWCFVDTAPHCPQIATHCPLPCLMVLSHRSFRDLAGKMSEEAKHAGEDEAKSAQASSGAQG